MNEICNFSAVELRRLIGTKEISAVEVLTAFRERIESVNPGVNAIVATCWARAEQEAKRADQAVLRGDALGLLHGV
ncbi:amidase, partial [Pseudomonas stutzeri]|nr:amidase [Stutzerimonas stutzeri]